MNPYFIVALPRSRTAWLANFLSHGPSFCFHEPMHRVDLDDYPTLLESTGARYSGVSDCINGLVIEELLDLFPEAKLVTIRRPVEEVTKSLGRLGYVCPELLTKLDRELDRIEHFYGALRIDFHNFNAARIWKFLVPDYPLNRLRLEQLEQFNITVPKDVINQKGLELVARAGHKLLPLIH